MLRVLTDLLFNFELTPKNLRTIKTGGIDLKPHMFILIYTLVLGQ